MVLRTFLFESAFTAALRTVGLLMSFMAIAFFTVLCLPVDLYLRGLLELAAELPVQQVEEGLFGLCQPALLRRR